MSGPKISIVVPTLNRRNQTLQCLQALKLQNTDHRLFEVIVVDNGSSDGTVEALHNFSSGFFLRVVRSLPAFERSSAAARNYGAGLAEAPIVLFLDCDMVTDPSLIWHHLDKHLSFDNVAVLGLRRLATSTTVFPDISLWTREQLHSWVTEGSWNSDEREKLWQQQKPRDGDLVSWDCLYSHNVSVKLKHFWKVSGFDPNFQGCGGEDVELGYRLYKFGMHFMLAREAIAVHEWHARTTQRWKDNYANLRRLWRKHKELREFCLYVLEDWQKKTNGRFERGAMDFRQSLVQHSRIARSRYNDDTRVSAGLRQPTFTDVIAVLQ